MAKSNRTVAAINSGPQQSDSKKTRIIHLVFAGICAIVIFLLVATKGFGITKPYPKAHLEDYSWAELQAISDEISAASNDTMGIQVASDFNLCKPDGTLFIDDEKTLKLTSGEKTSVRIIGIRHDDKADESGKAGLTFCFTTPIGNSFFNNPLKSVSGWETSDLRARINEASFRKAIPIDMRNGIKEVFKYSNSFNDLSSSVLTNRTKESIWLLSLAETCDLASIEPGAITYEDNEYNSEGNLYQYFIQTSVLLNDEAVDNEATIWTRSIRCNPENEAWSLSTNGSPYALPQDSSLLIAPAFCY